jgi:hypothetical protein
MENALNRYLNFMDSFISQPDYNTYLSELKPYEDKLKSKEKEGEDPRFSGYDFIPGYPKNHEKNSPLLHPLIQNYFNAFYEEFIGQYAKTMKFNLMGHFSQYDGHTLDEVSKMKTDWYHPFEKDALISNYEISLFAELITYHHHKKDGTLEEFFSLLFWKNINILQRFMDGRQCPYCNKSIYASINYDANEISVTHPESIKPCDKDQPHEIHITLKTPSKRLVFLNDFRTVFNRERDDRYEVSVNSRKGRFAECALYAKENMGYFHVSNTSPSIFLGDHKILISRRQKHKGFKKQGQIITDLWWYFVLDADLFDKLCSEHTFTGHIKNKEDLNPIYVDINSDEIKITHYDYYDEHEGEVKQILSKIELL